MTRQNIVERLLALPALIADAETAVITTFDDLQAAKKALQHKEDGLIFGIFEPEGMVIDGKNAEIRAAQLRKYTVEEQAAVDAVEREHSLAKHQLNKLQTELRALQTVAELISREVA